MSGGAPISFFPLPPFGELEGLHWESLRPGVDAAWFYRDGPDGSSAALLRYQPGAKVPEHEHLGWEHIFVLRGSQADDDRIYPAGTLTIFPPGWVHRVASADGCIALAIWTRPVQFTGTV